MQPTMYLVDHENIHSPALNAQEHDVVHIFYTQNACSISLDAFRDCPTTIVSHKVPAGKQSLDMHLVGHLGYLLGVYGSQYKYSVISRDSDYVRVVEYLQHLTNVEISLTAAAQSDKNANQSPANLVPNKKEVTSAASTVTSKSSQVQKPQPADKSALNAELGKILGKLLPSPESGQIVSSILKYYGDKNIKMLTYRFLIKKYKQKKGLALYEQIKHVL